MGRYRTPNQIAKEAAAERKAEAARKVESARQAEEAAKREKIRDEKARLAVIAAEELKKSYEIIDVRDGQVYRWTLIDGVKWMTSNMKYHISKDEDWYCGDCLGNCGEYGRMYSV
jgi:hypothetical protein